MIMLTKRSQRIQRCRKEIEPPVQSSVNPQNMETTAGEQRDQHPKGSTLAKEGRDLLRKSVIHSAGNFRSTPYQMGDNPAGDKNKYCSESNTVGNKGSSCQKINSAGGHKR